MQLDSKTGCPNIPLGAIGKTFAADMAINVTHDAVQVFGAAGCLRDFPLEPVLRNAPMFAKRGGRPHFFITPQSRCLVQLYIRFITTPGLTSCYWIGNVASEIGLPGITVCNRELAAASSGALVRVYESDVSSKKKYGWTVMQSDSCDKSTVSLSG